MHQQNYYERDTQLLNRPLVRQQILYLYRISAAMNEGYYNRAFDQINNYIDFSRNNQMRAETTTFRFQIQFMEAYCYYNLQNYEKTEAICKNILQQLSNIDQEIGQTHTYSHQEQSHQSSQMPIIGSSLQIRVITFLIVFIIEGHKTTVNPKQILTKLIKILMPKTMRIHLPQVLGTLTGCKSFIKIAQITKLTGPDDQRKASKLQILSVWKYLINMKDDCIAMKKKALEIWRQKNCKTESKICQDELNQLLHDEKGTYLNRLNKIKYFVTQLVKLDANITAVCKQTLVKWPFYFMLQELKPKQVINDKSSKLKATALTQSKMQREGDRLQQLNFIVQECTKFHSVLSNQKGGQISSLITNSKFVDEQTKKMQKKLGFVAKMKKKSILLQFFDNFKELSKNKKSNAKSKH